MCGITGWISKNKIEFERIREMVNTLDHRGPDETGFYLHNNVGLGQARLSIMDPQNGKQPATNEDDSIVVIFNGEIFNHCVLRKDLLEKGHKLKNNSDTAILPHMYEEYGLSMFAKLNGQFAIAIYNKRYETLILARDRLGEKPLYYYHGQGNLCFGSEVKAILKSRLVTPSLSPIALNQVFTFWTTLNNRSVFEDIFQLPPGSYLVFNNNEINIKAYWNLTYSQSQQQLRLQSRPKQQPQSLLQTDLQQQQQSEQLQLQSQQQPQLQSQADLRQQLLPPQHNNPKSYNIDDYTDELDKKLKGAVEARMMSDVPIAFYLSGGLDSSLITSIGAEISNKRLNTFSIAFDDVNFDESEYQNCMSEHLGTNHQMVKFSAKEIPQSIKEVITHTEVPLLRSGAFPMYALAKLVRGNDTKVVLSGEGSDELFGGYDLFREVKIRAFCDKNPESNYRASLYKRVNNFVKGLDAQPTNSLSLYYNTPSAQDCFSSHASRWRLGKYSAQFFSPEYRNQMLHYDGMKEVEESLPHDFMNWTKIQQAQYLEIAIFFSNYLLSSQGDRVSMAGSVECRYPFLDYDIVEFASALPDNIKIRALNEKYIIKKLAKKYLPDKITNRTKFPYRAPMNITQLMKDEYIHHIMSADVIKQYGIFNPISTEKFLSAALHKERVSERDSMLFMGMLTTQILCDEFIH
jgi:asparagine synthase (glutamine-hydrolysing)